MPPLLRDLNGFLHFGLAFGCVALFLRVSNQLLQIFALQGVQNVEEVIPVRSPALGHLGGEEHLEILVVFHHGPKLDHWQLVVERNTDSFHFGELEQSLFVHKDILEKIFVQHMLRWKVKLDWTENKRSDQGDLRASLKYLMKSDLPENRPSKSFGMHLRLLVPKRDCSYCSEEFILWL